MAAPVRVRVVEALKKKGRRPCRNEPKQVTMSPPVTHSVEQIALPSQAVTAEVWFASTAEVAQLIDSARSLAAVELAYARSLRQPADRMRFVAGRALLRHALTEAVRGTTPPAAWRYREGPHGKPLMDEGLPQIEFNLSHTADCVAVAVSKAGPVGIDIESTGREDCGDVILDVLTAREQEVLARMEPDRRSVEFIRLWTAKEACAKALGLGVAADFCELDIDLDSPSVSASSRLVGASDRLHIAVATVQRSGAPFCLCVAEMVGTYPRAARRSPEAAPAGPAERRLRSSYRG
jgi:phosphopantetheinyl transferase